MAVINIDKDTFRHALTNLTKLEVVNIVQSHGISIGSQDKKEEIVEKLLKILNENGVTEELYLAIKGKAFSVDKNFYDGFFYKFDKNLCNYSLNNLLRELKNVARNETKRVINIKNPSINNNVLCFTIEIVSSKPIYDIDEERSRYFKEKIDADVSIYFNDGLMYIHSKNITESKKIKTFIQKVLNSKELNLEQDTTIKLIEPTFDTEVSNTWIKDNTETLGGNNYSGLTIHMLDMLEEFNNGRNKFSGLCLKSIYFKYDTIEASEDEEGFIDELKYGGDNLQKHHRIKAELRDGKKITGFKFEVEHKYIEEDTEEEKISILPIVILYEKKYALRISINTESVSAEIKILHRAYNDVKDIFMNKFKSTNILNESHILSYLIDDEVGVDLDDSSGAANDEEWSFNG